MTGGQALFPDLLARGGVGLGEEKRGVKAQPGDLRGIANVGDTEDEHLRALGVHIIEPQDTQCLGGDDIASSARLLHRLQRSIGVVQDEDRAELCGFRQEAIDELGCVLAREQLTHIGFEHGSIELAGQRQRTRGLPDPAGSAEQEAEGVPGGVGGPGPGWT